MMSGRKPWVWAVVGILGLTVGCVQVKTPEKIEVGSRRPDPVDSSRVPRTASHEEAQRELEKAYAQIQYLERENTRLEEKSDKYKHERDDCRKRLDKYED